MKQVISILHSQGPPLGLFLNTSKCELFSKSDLSTFPPDMQRSIVSNIEILGAPIDDNNFRANFVAQKREKAGKLTSGLASSMTLWQLQQTGPFSLIHTSVLGSRSIEGV